MAPTNGAVSAGPSVVTPIRGHTEAERDPEVARKLRESRDAEALYAVLALPSASAA